MKKRFFFIFFVFTVIVPLCSAFPQKKKLIIKLKENVPREVLDNFARRNPESGNYSISKICSQFNVRNSQRIFVDELKNFEKKNISQFGFERIFIADADEKNFNSAVFLLSENEYVEYAEENFIYKLENKNISSPVTNDPYYDFQYYLNITSFNSAWNVSKGDSAVVIGVIDSGLDFLHPDLKFSYKINYGEYGNGKENNGIDDDNDGFIDNWRGWNFVDNNNNPIDDNKNSHGTAVTGIINAGFNNGIGIASCAPDCKVLVLKCFDFNGIGDEYNVSRAVLYGIAAGVKIFNFSFGDYVYSKLLKDVIRFAYYSGITMVCSAGNDGSNRLHYPSAYDEVISVAASDELDRKATFSSYGETVDIYAPGYRILTTSVTGKGDNMFNNDYFYVNGTSFSAPVVTSASALLLAENPVLTNEEIRGILVSMTDYLSGQNSWNNLYASGRINSFKSVVNNMNPSVARIYNPYQDFFAVDNNIEFVVSAASTFFSSYSLFYGTGENPSAFTPLLYNQQSQIISDTVFKWNISNLPDTSYTLRLAVNANNERTIEHRQVIFKDNSTPAFTDYQTGEMINKDNYSCLVLFGTDKKTLGRIYYKRKNVNEPYSFFYADNGNNNIGYVSYDHFGIFDESQLFPLTFYEYYIEAEAQNGKKIVLNDTSFYFRIKEQINNYGYLQKNYYLPPSQVCKKVTDVNNNNNPDVFINLSKNNLRLEVYEFSSGVFNKISNDNWGEYIIARDIADANGNNKLDLLASKGRNGIIFEQNSAGELPLTKIWSDENNDNFWSSGFADTDGDNLLELLGFGKNGLRILKSAGNNFIDAALLPYSGLNSEPNSQNTLIGDFNGNGKTETVFTDISFRGNSNFGTAYLSVYEYNNGYNRIFLDSVPMLLKADNLTAGDIDGDGIKEIILGLNSPSTDLVQYYSLLVYKYMNGGYGIFCRTDIYGYKSDLESSVYSSNVDTDTKDEILINTGGNFYILKYDNISSALAPVYYMNNINSYNQLVYDFDKDLINDFGLNNTSDAFVFYQKDVQFAGPETPLNFNGWSMDSAAVYLTFSPVAGADKYFIYRTADSAAGFLLYDSAFVNEYFDNNVINRKNYYYKITAVDSNKIPPESLPSVPLKIFVHNKSKIVSVVYNLNGFITVGFSERINIFPPVLSSFMISGGIGNPSGITVKNDFEYFLSVGYRMKNGIYSVKPVNLTDFYKSPVDTAAVFFAVNQIDTGTFFIKNASFIDKSKIRLEFNLDVDSAGTANLSNYSLEPLNLKIIGTEPDAVQKNVLYLYLDNPARVGATGKTYIVRVFNLYSTGGIRIIEGAGSTYSFTFVMETLDNVYVYPNPYSRKVTQNYITFANLTKTAVIYIYDITGKFLKQINETDGNGGAEWDLKDTNGNEITSGIYIFRVEGKNSSGIDVEEKIGKFAVVK